MFSPSRNEKKKRKTIRSTWSLSPTTTGECGGPSPINQWIAASMTSIGLINKTKRISSPGKGKRERLSSALRGGREREKKPRRKMRDEAGRPGIRDPRE